MTFYKILHLLLSFCTFAILQSSEIPTLRERCIINISEDIAEKINPEISFQTICDNIHTELSNLPEELRDEITLQLGYIALAKSFPLLNIYSHQDAITSLLFDPKDKLLISSSLDERIKALDINKSTKYDKPSGPLSYSTPHNSQPLACTQTLTACYGKNNLFTGTNTGHIGYGSPKKYCDYSYIRNNKPILNICAGKNDADVIWSGKRKLGVCNVNSERSQILDSFKKRITCLAYAPAEDLCMVGLSNGKIVVYKNYEKFLVLEENNNEIIFLSFCENTLKSVDKKGNIINWQLNLSEPLFPVDIIPLQQSINYYTASYTHDMHAYVRKKELFVANLDHEHKKSLALFEHPISRLAFSHDATLLACGDKSGNIFITPLPHTMSLLQVIFLIAIAALQKSKEPNSNTLTEMKSALISKTENNRLLFNAAISKLLNNKLKKIKWRIHKNSVLATPNKIKNGLLRKFGSSSI